jgi:DNA modification methylase
MAPPPVPAELSIQPTDHRVVPGDAGSLPGVDAGSIDLVVTSPPYPMIALWDRVFVEQDPDIRSALEAGRGLDAFEHMHQQLDRAWKAVERALRPGGYLCIVVGDATRSVGGRFSLYPNHSRISQACLSLGLSPLPSVLWSKPTNAPNKFLGSGMLPAGAYVTLEHEHILIFRKGGPRRYTSAGERERRRASAFFFEERNRWFSDRWALTGARQRRDGIPGRDRSAAFPLEIPYRLTAMFSLLSDRVLDPFAGTGTTLLAALGLGRSSVGIERDGALCGAAVERLLAEWPLVQARNRRRLEEHLSWLSQNPSRPPARPHPLYGCAVVSREERHARVLQVEGVERVSEHSVRAWYAPFSVPPSRSESVESPSPLPR